MKRGPKGPWKVKGVVLETLLEEHEKNPGKPSEWISKRILGKTGINVPAPTVRYHLRKIKKGRLQKHYRRRELYIPVMQAHHS
jgi:hypothetical protein